MLTIAIVSVLLTAPLGAILITFLGEKWLDKHCIKLTKAEMKDKTRNQIKELIKEKMLADLLKEFQNIEFLRQNSFHGSSNNLLQTSNLNF